MYYTKQTYFRQTIDSIFYPAFAGDGINKQAPVDLPVEIPTNPSKLAQSMLYYYILLAFRVIFGRGKQVKRLPEV
jgi:hypothetical protein